MEFYTQQLADIITFTTLHYYGIWPTLPTKWRRQVW